MKNQVDSQNFLLQRITAAVPLLTLVSTNKLTTSIQNLALLFHINLGIEEIMADHVHNEMTRNWILVYFRLFIVIVIKNLFLFLLYCDIEEPNGQRKRRKRRATPSHPRACEDGLISDLNPHPGGGWLYRAATLLSD